MNIDSILWMENRTLIMGYPPMYLIGIPIVCLAILAFCRKDTLWGTMIKLFNVFFASLIAMNYFAPVANLFDSWMVVMAYYNDMLAFFIVFGLALFILVEITNNISKVNVLFPEKVNVIGTLSVLFVMFVGFYFTAGFMLMTTLPEAPRLPEGDSQYHYPIQMKGIQFLSKFTLKPFGSNPNTFDIDVYLANENLRNCGVYMAVEDESWKFKGNSGNSPNISK